MKLFRYTRLNQHLITFLNDSELYFSSPLSFNDPYDFDLECLVVSHQGGGELAQRYQASLQQEAARTSRMLRGVEARYFESEKAERRLEHTARTVDLFSRKLGVIQAALAGVESRVGTDIVARIGRSWSALKQQLARTYGVVCFSASPTQMLLWSHYADGHRGVCLEFDSDERPVRGWKHYAYIPVGYREDRTIDVLDLGFDAAFIALLSTKGTAWAYEEEYRLITLRGPGSQLARLAALTGVFLGSRFHESPSELQTALFKALAGNQARRAGVRKLRFAVSVKVPERFEVTLEVTRDLRELERVCNARRLTTA